MVLKIIRDLFCLNSLVIGGFLVFFGFCNWGSFNWDIKEFRVLLDVFCELCFFRFCFVC